ncbi:MAG: hypothetical protein ACRKGH_08260 [Dehalogenimonas sp.]
MPAVIPQGDELYREEMNLPLIRWLMTFMLVIGLAFSLLLFGGVESNEPPKLVSVTLSVVFLTVAWLVSNFLKFVIIVTPEFVNLQSGRFRTSIVIADIQECRVNSRSSLVYGGWGLRITRFRDGWVKAYSFGRKRIDLVMKRGGFRHIVFSTENPEQLREIIHERQADAPRYV